MDAAGQSAVGGFDCCSDVGQERQIERDDAHSRDVKDAAQLTTIAHSRCLRFEIAPHFSVECH